MRVFVIALIALTITLALSCSDETQPPVATVGGTGGETTTTTNVATATPVAGALPKLQWTKADLQMGSWDGEQAILDTETGELLALTEKPVGIRYGSVRITDWNESGIYIRVDARRDSKVVETAMFRAAAPGSPFERLQPPAPEYEVMSPSGAFKLQFLEDRTTVLLDGGSGAPIQSFGEESRPGGFSADEQYLSVYSGGGERLLKWDGSRFVDTGLNRMGVWSPQGHLLAFAVGEQPHAAGTDVYVLDPDTAIETFIGFGYSMAWSPDGRYLAVWEYAPYVVSIFDVANGKQVLRASAALFARWLSDDTTLYVADYCGTSRFAVLNTGGAETRIAAESPGKFGFSLAPDNSRLAYRAVVPVSANQNAISFRIKELQSGSERTFDTGPYALGGFDMWSPDGRYLVLRVPAGKDGPCFMRKEGNEVTTVEVFD